MSEVVLRTDEATALAHALMAQIARDAGIRLLAIKGPVAKPLWAATTPSVLGC